MNTDQFVEILVPGVQGEDLPHMIERVLEVSDLRPSTRRVYLRSVRGFIDWIGGRPLNPTTLILYKNHLADRKDISPKTKNLYLSPVRLVFRRLFELGVLERDLSKSVRGFVMGSGHKKSPISDTHVRKVFRYLLDQEDIRLSLLFNLLYRQGLRQNEVVGITVEDVNLEEGTLQIRGKGQDDKETVFLHPETVEVFRRYLTTKHLRDGYVFPSVKKPGDHLTTTQTYRLVTEVHRFLGIPNSPHSWRKVFTSKLIDSGMDLLTVQRFTRHKSMEMLKVYYDRLDHRKKLPRYYEVFSEVVTVE